MLGVALRLAFREMRRNLMRSILTMLGIIIGVAAVIVLVTLGSGATQQVTQQIASLGSNLLMITGGKRMGPGQSASAPAFRVTDAEAIMRDVPDLVAVAPQASASSTAIYANENWGTSVTGSTAAFFGVNNRQIAEGRIFTASEARSGAAVCVIGETVRDKLFGSQSPLGARMRLQKLSCEIVGLLQAKGQSSMGADQDDIVVMPLRTFQRRISGNNDVTMIQVSAKDGVSTDAIKLALQRVLQVRRHISIDEDDNFNVMDMKEIATMLSGTTQMMTSLLGSVAAVSLLVGGIGIMNIMLVSVTERTREIGIRLAIGALEKEILLQFLVEAVVLSSTGGVVGIVLAMLSSSLLAALLHVPWVLNLSVILAAFAFSAGVGIVFGYVPARKAARMNPIEALRHE